MSQPGHHVQISPSVRVRPSVRPGPYIAAGLLVVLAMFGGLGTWAALAPLSGAVIAPGTVTVDTKRKTVQHLEGGIVAEILARDGDRVARGQLLIRLDETRASANLAILDGRLSDLKARRARLLAERHGADRVVFADGLLHRKDDPHVAEILAGQQDLFAARRESLAGEIAILQQSIRQFREEVKGLEAQQRSKARQVELIEDELAGLRLLYEKGYAPRTRILALERAAEQLKGERGEHVAEIAKARRSIGEVRLKVLQLQKSFREKVVAELREVQAEIFDLEERRVAFEDALDRLDIRAPRAGTVVRLSVHTLGAVIGPGEAVMDIVPQDDDLGIEARGRPQDVDKVQLRQTTVVRLSAFNLRTTPELRGAVIAVSADRLVDEDTREPYYLTRVRIPEAELAKIGELKLVPGMPAEVFIDTGERTALSYLLKPFSDGLARAFKDE